MSAPRCRSHSAPPALITGKLDETWIRTTRRWAIFSWFFLTLGNIFGARWAYEVLGWGGYWAWDPVENAAFMPWLVMTAYLHSVMIQERKDMLKVWNLALIGLAFLLTLFGTFITRSGVISSVHSFTQSGLGPYFLSFLILVTLVYTGALLYRLPDLRSPAEFESYLSREAAFLFNNLLLVGIAFAVFWGTIFPVLSEAVRGVKITVGPPFFNRVNGPLALGLIFLMGVGPLIAWRRMTAEESRRAVSRRPRHRASLPASCRRAGLRQWYVLTALSLAAFVAAPSLVEFRRGDHRAPPHGARDARQGAGESGLEEQPPLWRIHHPRRRDPRVRRHRRLVVFPHRSEEERHAGESFAVGPYQLRYLSLTPLTPSSGERDRRGRGDCARRPRGRRDVSGEAFLQEAAAARDAGRDPLDAAQRPLCRARGNRRQRQMATFQVFLTPLVFWLWAGGLVMVFGTVIRYVAQRARARRNRDRAQPLIRRHARTRRCRRPRGRLSFCARELTSQRRSYSPSCAALRFFRTKKRFT